MLQKYDEEDTPLLNCVLVIDEAHVYLDSRTSVSRKNRIISMFLVQTRKKNVHLYYTTQSYDQIDKRLRNNTDVIVTCETREIRKNIKITINNYLFKETNGYRHQKSIFVSNRFYDLYDTTQVISVK